MLAERRSDREILVEMFEAAVTAARPDKRIAALLPKDVRGRVVIVGAGKASAQMAQVIEECLDVPLSGVVVVPYGTKSACRHVTVVEAAHPVPDLAGMNATNMLFDAVKGLTQDDLVIAVISGGGSSLLPAPADGLTIDDEALINVQLLRSGADIRTMNVIRNQFSKIKGGRLAMACAPARVITLVVSDVPGDEPSIVASGPTIPSPATREEARSLVTMLGVELPVRVQELLNSDSNLPPSPNDPIFARNETHIVASSRTSLHAAAVAAASHGIEAHILSDGIEGEAGVVGLVHGAIAREVAQQGHPFAKPCVLISGGETTVTIKGAGYGGRNTEFLLALAMTIAGCDGITALAADTDGIDGRGSNAGAFCDGTSSHRMRQQSIDPRLALSNNDSGTAFATVGDLFVTGPTGTNVNDFRAAIIR